MEEGQNRVCGLVGRKGRCHGRVSHIGCPLFVKAGGGLSCRGVYRHQGHALSLSRLRRSFAFRRESSHEIGIRSAVNVHQCEVLYMF